jgi:hypothetical protein
MSSLAERLDAIRVHVKVPGADIEAELRGRTDVTLSFGRSVYEWLNEANLERFLAALARLLYVEWTRQYRAALSEPFRDAGTAESQRDRDFLAERDTLEAGGTSTDGRITVSATGMHNFSVRITRGSLRELSEREFVAGTREAVVSFLDDQRAKVRELKLRYFT